MFGAAAVRQKKRNKDQQGAAGAAQAARGQYSNPFGPRFNANDLPYFKYKRALLEAQLTGSDSTISKVEHFVGDDGYYSASSSANILLYIGLGMFSIGLVITFVGLGDKGFRTLELKMVGPCLVCCGLFFSLLRVLFCTVPACSGPCFRGFIQIDDKTELIVQDTYSSQDQVRKSARRNTDSLDSKFQSDVIIQASERKMSSQKKIIGSFEKVSDLDLSGQLKQKNFRSSQTSILDAKPTTSDSTLMGPSRDLRRSRLRRSVPCKRHSFDNFTSDTSSQFSTDIVEVERGSSTMSVINDLYAV